jgi:hypothetical protein
MNWGRLSIAILAMVIAACSTMKVKSQHDPAASFEGYKSYAWLANPPDGDEAAAIQNPAVREAVVAAVDKEMASKGLVLKSADAIPDFLVSVIGSAKKGVQAAGYGYSYADSYVYDSGAAPVAAEMPYAEGTMVLDFVDATTHKMFWRGTASELFTDPDPAAVKTKLDKAVKEMLATYPPGKA